MSNSPSVVTPGNEAKSAGAVFLVVGNEEVTFSFCTFQNNFAQLVGGAVMLSYDNSHIEFYGMYDFVILFMFMFRE